MEHTNHDMKLTTQYIKTSHKTEALGTIGEKFTQNQTQVQESKSCTLDTFQVTDPLYDFRKTWVDQRLTTNSTSRVCRDQWLATIDTSRILRCSQFTLQTVSWIDILLIK